MLRDISYKELSAWIMTGALIVSGFIYGLILKSVWTAAGVWVVPLVPFVVMTVILVVLAIFGHLIGAIFMRKTANEASDERDRQIRRKAGHLSGIILAASILMVLLATMLNPNGFFLFHAIFACLLVSQIAEYVLQIVYYRQSSAIGDVA